EDLDFAINLDNLDLTAEDALDNVDEHIQENLEDVLVKKALESGVDLREYAKQIEHDLHKVENHSISDCKYNLLNHVTESNNIARLHTQIGECDGILENKNLRTSLSIIKPTTSFNSNMLIINMRMECMLHGFQYDLSSISAEIQCLQEESVQMNIKLKNRQAVKSELSQLVDEMAVPEQMINHILDCPVTERAFLEQLHELNHKINFVKQHSYNDTAACRDVLDVVEKLKFKFICDYSRIGQAISKIREFLLTKIYSFRKPMSNYQLGQDAMLKSRFFYEFLLSNERHVAREVRDEYVDTLSKVYFSYFKTYINRLMKLQFDDAAGRDDLLATEDSSKRGFFSSSRPAMRNRSSVFTLGKRDVILGEQLEAPIVVPHAAQKNEEKQSFESLFRSQHYALLDTSCREYLFVCDFFMLSASAAQDLFNAIVGKTLALYLVSVRTKLMITIFLSFKLFITINSKYFVPETRRHAVFRVLRCNCAAPLYSYCLLAVCALYGGKLGFIYCNINILCMNQVLMNAREVTSLSSYWDTMMAILWPRFEYVVKMHIRSVAECNVQHLSSIDVRPHYITRRYAEFSAAVMRINENLPNTKVEQVLSELQTEVQNFILRLAACFGERKDQLVFLINNYDMMLSVIMVGLLLQFRTTEESKESDSFQQLLGSRTQEYVEEILAPHFGGMMAFVKDCEVVLESGQTDRLRVFEQKVAPLVQGFAAGWRTSVDLISREVTTSFTNFKVGSTIVQAAFTHLIQYYHRFQKLFTQPPFKAMPARSELVNMHLIMVEMKKYKPNF
uniref:Vacuolar protein sorting-associated protein 52 homolog n=1 Tax=Ciona savignyi TaxID=51511 RepID=H2Z2W5_CIOSA